MFGLVVVQYHDYFILIIGRACTCVAHFVQRCTHNLIGASKARLYVDPYAGSPILDMPPIRLVSILEYSVYVNEQCCMGANLP